MQTSQNTWTSRQDPPRSALNTTISVSHQRFLVTFVVNREILIKLVPLPSFRQLLIMLYKIALLSLHWLKRRVWDEVRCKFHRNSAICLFMIRNDPWYSKIALGNENVLASFPYHPACWFVATLDTTSSAARVEGSNCNLKETRVPMSSLSFCGRLLSICMNIYSSPPLNINL